MLIDHLNISVALVVLEEHNTGKIVEFSEHGISVLVHSVPELVVFSKANVFVIKAPVVVVILDHANLAKVSVFPVKVNEIVGSSMGILNGCGHWVVSDLMVEFLLELNHWDHPLTEAFIVNLSLIGVVPSLDEVLVGSTDKLSVEFHIFKDITFLKLALDWLLWDFSLDWKEIVWSIHGWLFIVFLWSLMVVFSVMVSSVLSLVVMVMSLEHLEEVWVSRCGSNAEKGNESEFVHVDEY